MKKTKINKISTLEILIGISAVIISLCALFVSISQVRLMQKQMHLSVVPRIDISFSNLIQNDSTATIEIALLNGGLGPAEIIAARIEYDSVSVGSWEELFQLMSEEEIDFRMNQFTSAKLKNRMLMPLVPFPILTTKGHEQFNMIDKNKDKIKITIFYKSLYNDYFEVCRENLTVSGSITNSKVNHCSFSEKYQFNR